MTTTIQTLAAALEGTRVHHATKAKAIRLEAALAAEYKGIEMDVDCEEDSKDAKWLFICDGIELDFDKVPELADVLEGFQALDVTEEQMLGADEEQAEDEEAEGGKSVVLEAYRQQYKVVSTNKQTNGDWLAETLTNMFWDSKAGFHVSGFEALLSQNGVDMSAPWAQVLGTKGGAGRFRMNGRQALEKRIALVDRFVFSSEDGTQVVVTSETDADFALWQLDNKSKHAGYLAKEAKRAAKEAKEDGGE